MFDIALGLFLDTKGSKIIALDEAHKVCLLHVSPLKLQYLTGTEGAGILSNSLSAVIRQQRHLGVRVIISTQEPTVRLRLNLS